jgi:C1A family cysteine protease
MEACLATGAPFVFAFSVYESFEDQRVASTGQVPMPIGSERVIGGHAAVAVGYDDAEQAFIVRNSWGSHWGDGGHFTLPYLYALQPTLAADFWTIHVIAR